MGRLDSIAAVLPKFQKGKVGRRHSWSHWNSAHWNLTQRTV